ncbi:MAG: wax ester/triacylglycerol synthase family O-acyltransferase [Actinomycetota bacterium]
MSWRVLTPLDSAFVTLEVPSTPLHIGVIIELEAGDELSPADRYEMIKANIGARIHEIPALTKRILRSPFDLAWPVMADDPHFNIDDHVIRRAVSSPGGDAELDALVGRVMGSELPPDRPLWELNVVEGLADGHRIAIVMKVHHALADGVSGAATFASLFDISPDVRPPAPLPSVDRSPLPTPVEMMSHTVTDLLKRPGALLEALASGLEKTAEIIERSAKSFAGLATDFPVGAPNVLSAARTSLNGTPGFTKNFSRLSLNLPEVKRAAKSRGATVTDFVMATVSGALQRLLSDRGEEIVKDLIAFVPINVRRQGAEEEMGNQFSAMLSVLRTDIADREERIVALASSTGKQATANRDQNAKLLMDLAAAAGPTLAAFAGRTLAELELFDQLPPVANVVVSSVPGPPNPLWLSGYRVMSAAPLGPLMAGLALNITVLGYVDRLEYGLLACARRVPELETLRDYLAEEAHYYLTTPAPSELETV